MGEGKFDGFDAFLLPPQDVRVAVLGAPVADGILPGHPEAAGDDLDEEVLGQEEVAAVVQRSQVPRKKNNKRRLIVCFIYVSTSLLP